MAVSNHGVFCPEKYWGFLIQRGEQRQKIPNPGLFMSKGSALEGHSSPATFKGSSHTGGNNDHDQRQSRLFFINKPLHVPFPVDH